MEKLTKQDTGKSGGETARENYQADEVAEQSSYQDSTEVAEQMREGEKTKTGAETHNDVDAGRSANSKDRRNQ